MQQLLIEDSIQASDAVVTNCSVCDIFWTFLIDTRLGGVVYNWAVRGQPAARSELQFNSQVFDDYARDWRFPEPRIPSFCSVPLLYKTAAFYSTNSGETDTS